MKVQLPDAVEKTIRMDLPSWLMTSVANDDCLAQTVAERFAMPMAKANFAMFHGIDDYDVEDQMIVQSSAGVMGWSEAEVDIWIDRTDSTGSTVRSPGSAAETGEEAKEQDAKGQPPILQPQFYLEELEEREKILVRQAEDERNGKETFGIYRASEINKVLDEQLMEVARDRREEA